MRVTQMEDIDLVDHFQRMVAYAYQIIPSSSGRGNGNIAKFEKKAEVAKEEILKRLKERDKDADGTERT